MGFKSKLHDLFIGNTDDLEEYEEQYDDQKPSNQKTDAYGDYYEEEPIVPVVAKGGEGVRQANIVPIHSKKSKSQVILSEPRVFNESQEIGEHLRQNRAVIVNMQRMSKDQSKQMIHFLSGVVFALEGTITTISQNTLLCVPNNVELAGSISNLLGEDDINHKGW